MSPELSVTIAVIASFIFISQFAKFRTKRKYYED